MNWSWIGYVLLEQRFDVFLNSCTHCGVDGLFPETTIDDPKAILMLAKIIECKG